MSGKYNEEVAKRLLYLKKLDGFPVIRMVIDNDTEEVNSTLDIKEIQRMAGDLEDLENAEGEGDGGGEVEDDAEGGERDDLGEEVTKLVAWLGSVQHLLSR